MRIISLLPAATEWVCAFGGIHDLVARSHLCTYPLEVCSVPVVTHSLLSTPTADSAGIELAVRDLVSQGLSPNRIDMDLLASLRPDVVIAQDDCQACAPFAPDLAGSAAGGAQVVSFSPMTLKQVIDGALRIGQAIGRGDAAMRYVAGAEGRLALLHRRLGLERRMEEHTLPSVVCLEWLEPLMAAAHWTPDVIRMAGGRAVLGEAGRRARTLAWDDVVEANPEVLVVAPCGFTVEQTLREIPGLMSRPEWNTLHAVRHGRVFVMDGASYLNRPGPRLYRSIEVLAAVIHTGQGLAAELAVQPWEVRRIGKS